MEEADMAGEIDVTVVAIDAGQGHLDDIPAPALHRAGGTRALLPAGGTRALPRAGATRAHQGDRALGRVLVRPRRAGLHLLRIGEEA